jgi:hypothetical protein
MKLCRLRQRGHAAAGVVRQRTGWCGPATWWVGGVRALCHDRAGEASCDVPRLPRMADGDALAGQAQVGTYRLSGRAAAAYRSGRQRGPFNLTSSSTTPTASTPHLLHTTLLSSASSAPAAACTLTPTSSRTTFRHSCKHPPQLTWCVSPALPAARCSLHTPPWKTCGASLPFVPPCSADRSHRPIPSPRSKSPSSRRHSPSS